MSDEYRNLLIGSGLMRDKRLEPAQYIRGATPFQARTWRGRLDTLDSDPECGPTMCWDLNVTPWRRKASNGYEKIPESQYDEIHAYEVLEHLGAQGDYVAFFETFTEIWRLLKPGGFLCGTCPSRRSQWLWGDPGHTRVIIPASLTFLSQAEYDKQVGRTKMTNYRRVYKADFEIVHSYDNDDSHMFVLQAVKPSRCGS